MVQRGVYEVIACIAVPPGAFSRKTSFPPFSQGAVPQPQAHGPTQKDQSPCGEAYLVTSFGYPVTSLLVFLRYLAGMGRSRAQVMLMGRLPSWLT